MRAALLKKPGHFAIVDKDPPAIGRGEVLIKVKFCGICGSDLHAYRGSSPDIRPPIVLGHEFSGQVVEVGEGVQDVGVGDRVCVEPILACGRCFFCQKGEYNRCIEIGLIGCQRDGAFAEYVNVEAGRVYRLPGSLSYEEGALIEPLAVAVHNVERADIKGGERVAVFGVGTVGNLIIQVSKCLGVSEVIAIDPVSWRLSLAKEMGADIVVDARREDVIAGVLRNTDGVGVDVSFEAAGHVEALRQAIRVTRKGGRIVAVGLYGEFSVSCDMVQVIFKELSIVGSAVYCGDNFRRALELVEEGRVAVKPLITHVFPLEEVNRAFETAMERDLPVLKVLLKP